MLVGAADEVEVAMVVLHTDEVVTREEAGSDEVQEKGALVEEGNSDGGAEEVQGL